jgi:hypothetical protein
VSFSSPTTAQRSKATPLRTLRRSARLNPTPQILVANPHLSSSSSFAQALLPPTPVTQVNPLLLPVFPMARENQPRIAFMLNLYAPLNLANVANPLNALPVGNYGKYMPKFAGNNAITVESHIKTFLEYLENIGVTEEDMVMRIFAPSLTLDARDWYKVLAVNNIDGWNTFHDRFMDKWSHKPDNAFLLKSFSLIKKDENKSMEEFNSRFMKAYYKIPHTVRPNPAIALIFYIE